MPSEYTKSPSPNPPNTMIVTTQSDLSNTPELTKQNSRNSNCNKSKNTKNNKDINNTSNSNILNTNIINNNNTPISPIIGPQQQQTHTHNITINNSNKEYK